MRDNLRLVSVDELNGRIQMAVWSPWRWVRLIVILSLAVIGALALVHAAWSPATSPIGQWSREGLVIGLSVGGVCALLAWRFGR